MKKQLQLEDDNMAKAMGTRRVKFVERGGKTLQAMLCTQTHGRRWLVGEKIVSYVEVGKRVNAGQSLWCMRSNVGSVKKMG